MFVCVCVCVCVYISCFHFKHSALPLTIQLTHINRPLFAYIKCAINVFSLEMSASGLYCKMDLDPQAMCYLKRSKVI